MTTTSNTARQTSIDAVRGFAVLGILLMNIAGMGLPLFAYIDPTYAGGADGANLWMWAANFVLADGKMRGLFTMLFGASMLLIADRAEGGRLGPNATHYRRMFWLLLFGLLHAYLFWYGDILVCYAIAGAIAFLLRKRSVAMLLGLGAGMLLVFLALNVLGAIQLGDARAAAEAPNATPQAIAAWREMSALVQPPPGLDALQTRLMLGDFVDAIEGRALVLSILWTKFLPFEVFEAIAQMLIGMALYKTGFFSLRWPTRGYVALLLIGYLVAAPATAYLAWHAISSGFDPIELNEAGAWSSAPRPFIALAHASALLLIIRAGALRPLTNRLAAAGQMALSNYLLTSIITAVIFCGFGFGLFGQLERAQLLWVVGGVWVFILAWSRPWLQRFHYGPFEWVWRTLVQLRPQPWRRPAPAAAAGVAPSIGA